MNDEELLRYSRHIMLPQIDIEGQEKLLAATVLIIGLGGLGCPAALYLGGAGVGTLLLADGDEVDLSNLQRQVAHENASIGELKVESAARRVLALNPGANVETLPRVLEGEDLAQVVARCDVVLDCTDNFRSRFAINRACAAARVPLVSGAAIRLEGQVAVFDTRREDAPCYRCLYEDSEELDLSCARNGVAARLVGIVGAIEAMEALKLIVGMGESLAGRLLLIDALTMQFREVRLARDPECPVCGDAARA